MSHGQYAKAKNNGAGVMPQMVPVQIPDVNACASYHCPNCMNNIFERALRIFEISALLSPIGIAQPAEQEVFRCTHCGLAWEQAALKKLTAKEREDLVADLKARKQEAGSGKQEAAIKDHIINETLPTKAGTASQEAGSEIVESLPVPGALAG